MCGRYASSASVDSLVETFEIDVVHEPPNLDWMKPRFNLAPTDAVPGVLQRIDKESGRLVKRLEWLHWGLVPSWSSSPAGAAKLINARIETVAVKPAFRRAVAARRCLLPADGYYEWEAVEPAAGKQPVKQPWFIRRSDGSMMAMAGIYEFWRAPATDGGDGWLVSCSIITTRATDGLGHVHDRMPVQVPRRDWDAWLDPTLTDGPAAASMLHEPSADELTTYRVSRAVNRVTNDGPELIDPLPNAG